MQCCFTSGIRSWAYGPRSGEQEGCRNAEDEKIKQQNAQINSGLILLLISHSNMFRPLSRSHHQGVRNPWELKSHCIDLLECCYVYVFTSRYDSCGMLSIPQPSYRDVNTYT